MQSFKDKLKGTTDRLRNLGGPADALERRIFGVVDRATSEMMINPDWGVNMELVDIINTEPSPPCYERVCKGLRRRLWKANPKIQLLTLTLLETCVKNTGTDFQVALVHSDLWEEVIRLADPKKKADLQVQDKVLIMVEDCAHALAPPDYKTAYDTLKVSGVRFPTRPAEEIGAGFNLPPTRQDAQAMAGVSQEDQRAIQEALTDLSTTEAPPPHAPQPATVQSMETGQDSEKLRSDMRFVANSVELLKDALGSIPYNEPDMVYQDYIKDLSQQCVETVPKLKKLIEGAVDEGILAEALALNDELGTVLQRYESMKTVAEDAKKLMTTQEEEPSLLALDDAVMMPMGQGTSTTPDAFDALAVGPSMTQPMTQPMMSQPVQSSGTDPFDLLAAETSTPSRPVGNIPTNIPPPPPAAPQGSTPKKTQDPFEDLISL